MTVNHRTLGRDKLKSSGLTDTDGKKLDIEVLTADQTAKLCKFNVVSLKIHYHDRHGKKIDFYRLRFLEDTRTGLLRQSPTSEPHRYWQPAGTGVEVYLPTLIDWDEYLSDPTKRLIITEGELKAACATKHGFPTVGLGGVWSFKSKKQNVTLLPWFNEVKWNGRDVHIIYDSDAITNPDIAKAENTLCRELLRLGAKPHIVRLPALKVK